jgi:hypothetical protein
LLEFDKREILEVDGPPGAALRRRIFHCEAVEMASTTAFDLVLSRPFNRRRTRMAAPPVHHR